MALLYQMREIFYYPLTSNPHADIDKIEPGWLCFQNSRINAFGTVQGLIANISNTLMKIMLEYVSSQPLNLIGFIKSRYMDKSVNLLTEEGWIVEQNQSVNDIIKISFIGILILVISFQHFSNIDKSRNILVRSKNGCAVTYPSFINTVVQF